MVLRNIPTFLVALLACVLLSESKTFKDGSSRVRKFPDEFLFGAATASYQVEGGWDADGKSQSIWDYITHTNPCAIADCQNGDIANDSYRLYKRDVEMLRELGVDVYRFSIAWTRVLPSGFPNNVNEAGVQYYNNLIDELLKHNITPLVTMFHWDLPQSLQDLGGWANPHVVDWFSDYARVLYEKFGDRVKHWITINEPSSICVHAYGDVWLAPQLNSKAVGEYMCSKYLLLAHAKAYHIYDKDFRESQGGEVGIAIVSLNFEPETENDVEAAEIIHQFSTGQFAHPIFSETGDWPPIMKERVAAKSAAQGFPRTRLPDFSPEEIELVRGSSDFYGLNHYTTYVVYHNASVEGLNPVPSFEDDHEVMKYQPSEWPASASYWLKSYPVGFYKILKRVHDDFNNPRIYITENGISNHGGLIDDDRISYYKAYLSTMLDAMDEGCDVQVYCLWSLMDNFEWMEGYTERFGIYEVDYSSPERTRTPRKSAFLFKEIMRTRSLDLDFEPEITVMTIDEGH